MRTDKQKLFLLLSSLNYHTNNLNDVMDELKARLPDFPFNDATFPEKARSLAKSCWCELFTTMKETNAPSK